MQKSDKNGFSFIEMAIVLVIIGLIVGTIVPLLVSQIKQDKVSEARDIVRLARDEVIGFAADHTGRLPDQNEFQNNIGHRFDPWNQELRYYSNDSSWICGSSGFSSFDIKLPDDNTISDVAFLVASMGEDYTLDADLSSDPKELSYDDIVEYVTFSALDLTSCNNLKNYCVLQSAGDCTNEPSLVIIPSGSTTIDFNITSNQITSRYLLIQEGAEAKIQNIDKAWR